MNGNSDELIRRYLDGYALEWRFLETRTATTQCRLFGKTLDTPILLGGMAHYDRLQPGGAPQYAKAARKMNTAIWTGFCSRETLEQVIAAGAPAARILKPFADQDDVLREIAHDVQAGACAVAMDIDHVYDKSGRNGSFGGKPLAAPDRAAIEAFSHAGLPFFAKGVLSVRDAVLCAEAGAAGVVLSSHQNMFPWSVPPVQLLQEVRAAVGRHLTVLVDSGLTSGYDVFKALAWGADGVFTVRPMIPLFRDKGEDAVAQKLSEMTDELRACLSRTGAEDIYHIDPAVVRKLQF